LIGLADTGHYNTLQIRQLRLNQLNISELSVKEVERLCIS